LKNFDRARSKRASKQARIVFRSSTSPLLLALLLLLHVSQNFLAPKLFGAEFRAKLQAERT
jgi:NADH:ubiquinone oxidoreductase subunit 5 (subunit L)/multisubunit Na+/H+ antiporter MnhA subunit